MKRLGRDAVGRYFVPLFRLLPVPLLDLIVNLIGINASMQHFTQTR